MQHAPSGDWKRVDWDALAAWLDRYGCKVLNARRRPFRRRRGEWERKGKNASSLNQ